MCGIAGRILSSCGCVGSDLVDLMSSQSHRGADSTGFAIYGIPHESDYILRGMGFDKTSQGSSLDSFIDLLRTHGGDLSEDPTFVSDSSSSHYSFRLVIRPPTDLPRWISEVDSVSNLEVQSCGRSLEIIKDVGDADEVAEKHNVRDLLGTHGLGHARLATESSVLPNASHPFWARPFLDVAIVHNGQITDYFTWRERLERRGYRFLTENDSELIAVWVSDRMKDGLTMEEALTESITSIDGVFTYMIANLSGIGFAKDRFAMKPIVSIESSGSVSAATEEQAVRCIVTDECDVVNYDGPGLTGFWGIGRLAA